MPPPVAAAYVGGVVLILGVGYVVKQFVYEPYVAPTLERWATAFLASRRRMHEDVYASSSASYRDDHYHDGDYYSENIARSEPKRRGDSRPSSMWSGDTDRMPPASVPPIELEKMVERERMAWAERDADFALGGLRRRPPPSRPVSRPASFIEPLIEVPGLPVSAYKPITPAHTNEPGSPPFFGAHPLASGAVPVARGPITMPQSAVLSPAPSQGISQILSPMPSQSIPVIRPLASSNPPSPSMASPYPTLDHLAPFTSPSRPPSQPASLVPSLAPSPYPSRPASALSSIFSPPHSPGSLRSPSWTDVSQASGDVSDADVLSADDRDIFGTDDELESVSELGSAWDAVSNVSGVSD